MQAFLVASVAALLGARKSGRAVWLAGFLAALFLACGFRHNAITAALPLIGLAVTETGVICARRYAAAAAMVWRLGLARLWHGAVAMLLVVPVLGSVHFVNSFGVQDYRLYTAALVHGLAGISVRQNVDYLPE